MFITVHLVVRIGREKISANLGSEFVYLVFIQLLADHLGFSILLLLCLSLHHLMIFRFHELIIETASGAELFFNFPNKIGKILVNEY